VTVLAGAWSAIKWSWDNFSVLAQIVGAASIGMTACDKLIDAAKARWNNSFWNWLDKSWDGGPGKLGVVANLLWKLALNRQATGPGV
jgi:hypothetical protein